MGRGLRTAGGAIAGARLGSIFGPIGTFAGGLLGGIAGWFSGSSNDENNAPEVKFHPAPRLDLSDVQRAETLSFNNIQQPQLVKIVSDFFASNTEEDEQLKKMKQNSFERYLNSVNNMYKVGISSPTAFNAMRNALAQQNAIIGEINKAVENNDPNTQDLVLPATIKENLAQLSHNLAHAQEYTATSIKELFRQKQTELTNALGEKANSSYGMNARTQLAREEADALTQNNIYWLTEGTGKALDAYKKAIEIQHEQRMNPIREAVANEDQYLQQVIHTRNLKRQELQDAINVKQTEYLNSLQRNQFEDARRIEREVMDLKRELAQHDANLRAYSAENNSPYVQSQLMDNLFARKYQYENQLALDNLAFQQVKHGIRALTGRPGFQSAIPAQW